MKIQSITPTSFNGGLNIMAAENKGNELWSYHVLKIARDFKLPANFHTNNIELPSVSKAIIEKLNELGIKFNNK